MFDSKYLSSGRQPTMRPGCVARMHWRLSLHRKDTRMLPLSSSLPHQWRTDKHPPHHLHARPLPLRRRCCASLRVSTPALPPHRAITSSVQARIAPTQHATIKGDLPRAFVCAPPPPLPSSGKPSTPRRLCFSPLRRCQAASPHISPHMQVSKLRRAPELLPDRPSHIFSAAELRRRRPHW
jgi:hypothetical protein